MENVSADLPQQPEVLRPAPEKKPTSRSNFRGLRSVGLVALALALSTLTVVLGAAPFRVLRLSYGRKFFWLSGLFVTAALASGGLIGDALVVLAVLILVGIYSEIEDHGGSVFMAGAVATLSSFGTIALVTGLWLHESKTNLLTEARTELTPLANQMVSMFPNSGVDVETLLRQLPSELAIGLLLALAIALISERGLAKLLGTPILPNALSANATSERLRTFRVPDFAVWIVMLAILGEFMHHGIVWLEVVSANTLNILVLLYFFQGLAVVSQVLRKFKVSPFWQGIWYVLVVVQLFLIVSFVGFADFWLDFRQRLARPGPTVNKAF